VSVWRAWRRGQLPRGVGLLGRRGESEVWLVRVQRVSRAEKSFFPGG
jgi:hypothetical protein